MGLDLADPLVEVGKLTSNPAKRDNQRIEGAVVHFFRPSYLFFLAVLLHPFITFLLVLDFLLLFGIPPILFSFFERLRKRDRNIKIRISENIFLIHSTQEKAEK